MGTLIGIGVGAVLGGQVEADLTLPSSIATSTDGTQVVLSYGGTAVMTAVTTGWTVKIGGVSKTLSAASASGTDVTLTLSTAVIDYDDTVTVSMDGGTCDLAIGGTQATSITDSAVTNSVVRPTAASYATSADGTTITITYTGLTTAVSTGVADWSAREDTVDAPITSVAAGTNTIVLTMTSALSAGTTIDVSFTHSASDVTAGGITPADFSQAAVTNNVSSYIWNDEFDTVDAWTASSGARAATKSVAAGIARLTSDVANTTYMETQVTGLTQSTAYTIAIATLGGPLNTPSSPYHKGRISIDASAGQYTGTMGVLNVEHSTMTEVTLNVSTGVGQTSLYVTLWNNAAVTGMIHEWDYVRITLT